MAGWLSSWLVSPMLMWMGLAAISIPIIIHLLNRRRFKIVDWAAMKFLLDADKKNRRRVQIENLILLMLRCLAMLLIGLMLARPFLDPQMLQGVLSNPKYERIVVLDDSLSMQLQTGNENSLDQAVGQIEQLLQKFVGGHSEDSLTVFVSSRPDEPLFANEPITGETLESLGGRIKEIETSDTIANFDEVLQSVDRYVHSEKQNVNRSVYVFSDFREHDWRSPGNEENPNAPNQLVRSISEVATDCLLVDVGTTHESNVTITSIRPEETLISGVANQFHVEVANQSTEELYNVRVRLRVGDTLPLERELESLGAGEREIISFDYVFASDPNQDFGSLDTASRLEQNLTSYPVQAEVVGNVNGKDHLLADSQAYYAARVIQGIPVLLVDGDSSADAERSESFFLGRALSPPGETMSGVLVDTKTDIEFESIPISDYRVIVLCNVRELSSTRVALLKEWVKNGGGLVLMPGDQTIAQTYNEMFYEKGHGLSPTQLVDIRGDVDEQTWAHFQVDENPHSIFRIFEGQDNPFLNAVKIFSWWGVTLQPEIKEGEAAGEENVADSGTEDEESDVGDESEEEEEIDPAFLTNPIVLATLNDPDQTPVVVEKRIGQGRVISFAIPADRQWSDWPDNPSYVIANQELIHYVAGDLVEDTDRQVGTPIVQPIDLAQYQRSASLLDPNSERFNLDAVPVSNDEEGENGEGGGESESDDALWQVSIENTSKQGFYELELTRNDGNSQSVLFSANVDSREGNLKRFRLDEAGRGFFGPDAEFVSGESVVTKTGDGTQSELWFFLLFLLGGVLMLEQFLGWMFGRRR